MTEQEILDRAVTLAEIAPNDSVTISLLAGEEGRFSGTAPLTEPPVTHLEQTESPAFILANKRRGIGLGSKRNTISPARTCETLIIVTGRRTLCLVGQGSTDEVVEIPHESVAETTVNTGFRAHRLALQTPRNIYHCWVNRKTDTDLLDEVSAFIRDRQQDEPVEMESEENASRVMYRGQPVKSPEDETAAANDDQSTVMYRGRPVDNSSE